MTKGLREMGVAEGELAGLAREAAGQWTGGFNPRDVGVGELEGIYRRAWGG